MKFEYLEVRPCIELRMALENSPTTIGDVVSYVCEEEFEAAKVVAEARTEPGVSHRAFWSIYGRYNDPTPDGKSQFLAMAIGDFETKKDAHGVMNAILAPMAAARDALDAGTRFTAHESDLLGRINNASSLLEDFINQCSNMERI